MRLSDNEKRDAIKLIQEGKPLPEKYRFLFFDDDREVELLWNGKTQEVCNFVLPFQTIEHIDKPRSEEIKSQYDFISKVYEQSKLMSGLTKKINKTMKKNMVSQYKRWYSLANYPPGLLTMPKSAGFLYTKYIVFVNRRC